MIVEEGQLKGSFKGFKDRDTIYEFFGGRKWRQAEYKYSYHYAYMPRAKVTQEGGRYVLTVEGMGDSVEVCRE
ncbi:MAG: hypothetical protein FD174_3588 [Geobacteraceae bacterium]|nr:MAG: hypothetical protein FD174_3588 [Geobacteraceae bacterium]